jgi:hypothetical protein
MKKSSHPDYRIWATIVQRCCNPKCKKFIRYGGRGITLYPPWRDFIAFNSDMGDRPSKLHSIERIDNSKGYYPSNCKWATALEQANNKSINHVIEFNGKRQTMAQWGRELGIPARRISYRLLAGWSIDNALKLPPSMIRLPIEQHKMRKS